jgi:hypothetical protein
MRSLTIVLLNHYCMGDKIEKNEMGGSRRFLENLCTCGLAGVREEFSTPN